MYAIREVQRGNYDDRGYSNEETIAHLMLSKPSEINSMLTYTFGMDDDRFPLNFLTEGQGAAGTVDIDTTDWTWKTMGRMKFNDTVLWFNTANTTPGKGGAFFEVEFRTHWFIEQYGLIAPDGVTQVRIMKDLGKGAHGGYLYRLRIANPNPNAYVDVAKNLAVGKSWSLTAPTIPESYSKGNRTNTMGPGKMTSQLEFHRFSKEIAGNIANTVVTYEFKTSSGGTTNLWINEEMRQFELQQRVMNEERLWFAEYNKTINGEITMVDPDNGQPIPYTAGMQQICRESNYDTYGEELTLNKLNRTIGDILDKDTDTGKMDVVLACGKGFVEDFDRAIKNDAKDSGFVTPLGDKMIQQSATGLTYGNYFRQYKTVDGHIITLKHLSFLDRGTFADNAKANGDIHPRTGYPMTSHQAFMLDTSSYDGHNNIRKVRKKGQVYINGIIKGLTPIPASWGAVPTNSLATDIDCSRYEVKNSYGLQVDKATKFFQLKCVL